MIGTLPDYQWRSDKRLQSWYLVILVLLGDHQYQSLKAWRAFLLKKHHSEGGECIALTPAPLSAYPPDFKKLWKLVPWETGRQAVWDKETREKNAERLLGMLSLVPKLQPGLLREVRQKLTNFSVVAECDLWSLPEIIIANPGAAVASEKGKRRLQEHFRALSAEQKNKLYKVIRNWYVNEDSLYFESVIALETLACEVVGREDLDAALNFVKAMAEALEGTHKPRNDLTFEMVKQYAEGFMVRTQDKALSFKEVRKAYSEMLNRMNIMGLRRGYAANTDPAALGGSLSKPIKLKLLQKADQVVATSENVTGGSLLAEITTKNHEFLISKKSFWQSGNPPGWASDWGDDEYGPWVEFTLVNKSNQSVTQRLRWIGPGSFDMGSPDE